MMFQFFHMIFNTVPKHRFSMIVLCDVLKIMCKTRYFIY